MNQIPLYILGKKSHWCKKLAGKSINADFFFLWDLKFINPSKFRNIILMIISPFYFIFLPKKEIYLVSDIDDLLICNFKRIFSFRKFKTFHIVFSDYYSENHKGFKRKFMNYLAKMVDGAIVQGSMTKSEIRKQKFTFPVKISNPYPYHNKFFNISGDIKSKNVINIGIQSRLRKGEDIFYMVAKKFPQINFYLLGDFKNIPKEILKKINEIQNVYLTGYIDPLKYVSKCTFYLMPGRYDSGPISVTEAMASGLIPIISNRLGGGRDLVNQVRKDLVIKSLNPRDYIDKLNELMDLSDKELKELSVKSKKVASNWTKEKGMKSFSDNYNLLLKESS